MQDVRQVRVAAGGGDAYFAPVGATLPVDATTSLDAAFIGGGYITDEGATYTYTPEFGEIRSWQSRSAILRYLTGADFAARWTFQQHNADNMVFSFGGGAVTEPRVGVYRYDFPADDAEIEENAVVIAWRANTYDFRLVMPRGNVSEGTETQLTRDNPALLPITFRALGGAGNTPYIVTNDPNWAVGS